MKLINYYNHYNKIQKLIEISVIKKHIRMSVNTKLRTTEMDFSSVPILELITQKGSEKKSPQWWRGQQLRP